MASADFTPPRMSQGRTYADVAVTPPRANALSTISTRVQSFIRRDRGASAIASSSKAEVRTASSRQLAGPSLSNLALGSEASRQARAVATSDPAAALAATTSRPRLPEIINVSGNFDARAAWELLRDYFLSEWATNIRLSKSIWVLQDFEPMKNRVKVSLTASSINGNTV